MRRLGLISGVAALLLFAAGGVASAGGGGSHGGGGGFFGGDGHPGLLKACHEGRIRPGAKQSDAERPRNAAHATCKRGRPCGLNGLFRTCLLPGHASAVSLGMKAQRQCFPRPPATAYLLLAQRDESPRFRGAGKGS